MYLLLFVFEMVVVLGGIALVPTRSELSPSRNIERERENSLRSQQGKRFRLRTNGSWI
jgi:hypothetical protein